MTPEEALLLAGGGLVAGVVNTLAGGGSLLTVPLLVVLGLPGTLANGTNRVGILLQSAVAAWRFRQQGVWDVRRALPEIGAVAVGAVTGAVAVSRLSDAAFERSFGLLMLVLLIPTLRRPRTEAPIRPRPLGVRLAVFLGIGLYGGAFQAGVGFLLLFALAWTGYDLVRANGLKVAINTCLTVLAVPIFILAGQVAWPQALALAAGFALGGELGARLAVRGGEALIRPVLAVAVAVFAGRLLGFY